MTVKAKWNDEAFRRLLLDPEIQRFVDRIGENLAKECGFGYEYRPPTRNMRRDRGIVVAAHPRAKYDNAKHLTLLRVVHA